MISIPLWITSLADKLIAFAVNDVTSSQIKSLWSWVRDMTKSPRICRVIKRDAKTFEFHEYWKIKMNGLSKYVKLHWPMDMYVLYWRKQRWCNAQRQHTTAASQRCHVHSANVSAVQYSTPQFGLNKDYPYAAYCARTNLVVWSPLPPAVSFRTMEPLWRRRCM